MKYIYQLLVVLMLGSWGLVAQGAADHSGRDYFERGQFELAVQTWEGELSEPSLDKNSGKYIDTSIYLAAAYQKLGHLKKAYKLLDVALPLAEKGGDPVRHARVLMQLSGVYVGMRDFQENSIMNCMKKEIDEDATYFTPLEHKFFGKVGNNEDTNSFTPRRFLTIAKHVLNKAEEIIVKQKSDNTMLLANIYTKRIILLFHEIKDSEEGQEIFFDKILPIFKDSIDTLNRTNDDISNKTQIQLLKIKISLSIIQGVLRFGSIEYVRDEYKIEPANILLLVKDLPNSHDKVFALIDLARLMPKWQRTLNKKMSKTISEHKLLSSLRLWRFNVLMEALKIAHLLEDKLSLSYSKSYLAKLYAEEQRYDKAIELTRKAIYDIHPYYLSSRQKSSGEKSLKNFASKQSRIYIDSIFDKASKETCEKECIGHFSVETDFPNENCKGICQPVSSLFLQGYNPERLFRLEWQLAKFLKANNSQETQEDCLNAVEAKSYECAYKRASEYLQQARVGYKSLSQNFLEKNEDEIFGDFLYLDEVDAKDFYFDWVNVLLLQTAKLAVNKQIKLQEALNVIEHFEVAEVQNYFQDECITALEEQLGYENLPKGVAIFYPLLFDDRIELLLSLQQGKHIEQKTVHLSSRIIQELKSDIEEFRSSLFTSKEYRQTKAKKLYKLLITPIKSFLYSKEYGIKNLIIIPHGVLYNMPFAALCGGVCDDKEKNRNFLINENFALSFASSVKLINFGKFAHLKKNTPALLNGSQSFLDSDVAPLSQVPKELNAISCALSGRLEYSEDCQSEDTIHVLQDNNFTFAKVEKHLEKNPYSILHFATHTKFSRDMRNISLLTFEGEIPVNELARIVANVTNKNFSPPPIKLLTLSACSTARGESSKGEFRKLGLAGILLKTGIPRVVGTLDIVDNDNQGITILMGNFYKHLFDKNTSIARALQEAQLEVSKTNKPYDWAQFVLVGNGL